MQYSLVRRRLDGPGAPLQKVAQHVRFDRQYDDEADSDHLEEDIDVEQVECVADDADHEGADERVTDVAATAQEARAANDDCGNGVELEQVAVQRPHTIAFAMVRTAAATSATTKKEFGMP